MSRKITKSIVCFFVVFSAIFVIANSAFALPEMYEIVSGEPEQGNTIEIRCYALAALPTLKCYLADHPRYTDSVTTVEQTITYRGGWGGPVRFTANFTGFSDGDLVYVILSNGDPATDSAAVGLPIRYGYPHALLLEGDTGTSYAIISI